MNDPREALTSRTSRRWGAIAAVVVILGTFGYLLYGGLDQNVVFFLEPRELLAKGEGGYDVPVRLGGQVKPGSVLWDEKALALSFDVVDTTSTFVHVSSKGVPPQMFRGGMGVIVEGRLGRDKVFRSTSLMVKHSNEYRAPKPGERPSEMYKSLMKSGTP